MSAPDIVRQALLLEGLIRCARFAADNEEWASIRVDRRGVMETLEVAERLAGELSGNLEAYERKGVQA